MPVLLCAQCGLKKASDAFFKDKTKPHGHKYACKACMGAKVKADRAAGDTRFKEASARFRAANRERYNAYMARWREANRDKVHQADSAYYTANVAKRVAKARKREADALRATPKWADHERIAEIYAFAAEFKAAGFDVHVDHIIPLRGENVRGLHVHTNLRPCLASNNLAKKNVLDESLL